MILRILPALLLCTLSLSVLAQPALAEDATPSFPARVTDDAIHVVSAPLRWDGDDWSKVGWSTAAVLLTAATIDRPWRDEMRRHARADNRALLQVERLGGSYSVAVVGGFYAVGVITGNEETMSLAEDSFTASLIASVIVTPAIKLTFGRARPRTNQGTHYFKPFSDLNASFPSGHTAEAFALATVISGHTDSDLLRYGAYGLAGIVGFARTYHDAHFASDVLAGALIGSYVADSVVSRNRDRRANRTGKLTLVPEFAPGMAGLRLAGNF